MKGSDKNNGKEFENNNFQFFDETDDFTLLDKELNISKVTINEDEEIDEDLLFAVLDHIAEENIGKQINLPSPIITKNIEIEKSMRLQKSIKQLLHSDYWSNDLSDDLSDRPMICMICKSIRCQHIQEYELTPDADIFEKAMKKCTHAKDDDTILNACIKCIIEISKELQDNRSKQDIVVLWDTIDTASFNTWLIDINLEYGLVN